MPNTSQRPTAYDAKARYEDQERALRHDLARGCHVDVNLLCRAGRAALIQLERSKFAKVVVKNGRSTVVRTYVSRHPLIHLGYLLGYAAAIRIAHGRPP